MCHDKSEIILTHDLSAVMCVCCKIGHDMSLQNYSYVGNTTWKIFVLAKYLVIGKKKVIVPLTLWNYRVETYFTLLIFVYLKNYIETYVRICDKIYIFLWYSYWVIIKIILMTPCKYISFEIWVFLISIYFSKYFLRILC